MPDESQLWLDGKACHTRFQQDASESNFKTVHLDLEWRVETEKPITSVSFVLYEKGRDQWHNNGGKDYHIEFDIGKNMEAQEVEEEEEKERKLDEES